MRGRTLLQQLYKISEGEHASELSTGRLYSVQPTSSAYAHLLTQGASPVLLALAALGGIAACAVAIFHIGGAAKTNGERSEPPAAAKPPAATAASPKQPAHVEEKLEQRPSPKRPEPEPEPEPPKAASPPPMAPPVPQQQHPAPPQKQHRTQQTLTDLVGRLEAAAGAVGAPKAPDGPRLRVTSQAEARDPHGLAQLAVLLTLSACSETAVNILKLFAAGMQAERTLRSLVERLERVSLPVHQ